MLLNDIDSLLKKKLFPKKFKLDSEIYGLHYDQNRNNKLIKRVMLTIDLSLNAIHFALKKKINLIISHHGLINEPIKNFKRNLINKLTLLNKYPISVFVLSSPFIASEGGVSDTLANMLYLKSEETFNIKSKNGFKVPIGRICSPKNYMNNRSFMTLEELIKRIKTNLDLQFISYVGDLKKLMHKICIVGGDTPNINYIKKVINLGCDCYISGKIGYFEAVLARDTGLALIETSHYKNEIHALRKIYKILSLQFPNIEFTLFESNDPFKTYF